MRAFRTSTLVGLLTASHFACDFYGNFLPPLLPVVIANLGLSLTASGILVMASSIASCLIQPVCGYYIDRSGYAWLILLALPLSAVFICLAGVAPSYGVLLVCVILAGIGSSVYHPLGSSLLSKIAPSESKGLTMSVFIGGGNFGFAIAPALIIALLVNCGPGSLLWLVLPGLALSIGLYYTGFHRINLAVPPRPAGPTPPAWYKSSSLLKLNLVMTLRAWTLMALPTFLPVMLALQGHDQTLAGELLTVFLTANAVGGLIGGWANDRIGRRLCVFGSLAISVPTLFLFLSSDSLSLTTWLALAIGGAALQASQPSSVIWAQDMIPANAALASGMMLGLSFGLGGFGVALTGAMADITGLHTALLLSLLPLVLAIPLTYFIPEREPAAITKTTAV